MSQPSKFKLTPRLIEGFVASILAPNFDQPKETPDFHRELWKLCCLDDQLVAVAAPRGHAKTTAVTHCFTLATILFRAHQFVLVVSDTESQAVDFLRDIKKELSSNETLREQFGVKGFAKDSETDVIVEFDDDYVCRILAKGSEQKVRGLKWNNKRPDLIICDDLENDEIVMNKERRDKFKRWFRGALMPCRSPYGKVRVVGTILHTGSMLNDLMPKTWHKTVIQEPLKIYDTNPRAPWKAIKFKAHDVDFKNILWKDQFSRDRLLAIRKEYTDSGYPDVYSQEYLNEPLDESVAFFKRADFAEITLKEKEQIRNKEIPLLFYAGADMAISLKERADWSVFHVIGVDSRNIAYHMETVRERLDGRQIVDQIIDLQQKYQLQWFAIETEKITKAIGPFLREEMQRRNVFVNVVEIAPSMDKPTRAKSIQARLRMNSIRFDKDAEYYPKLEDEFIKFPRDIHDDQVDAYSVIGLALDKMITANTKQEQELEDWDEFDREHDYSGFYFGRDSITNY